MLLLAGSASGTTVATSSLIVKPLSRKKAEGGVHAASADVHVVIDVGAGGGGDVVQIIGDGQVVAQPNVREPVGKGKFVTGAPDHNCSYPYRHHASIRAAGRWKYDR